MPSQLYQASHSPVRYTRRLDAARKPTHRTTPIRPNHAGIPGSKHRAPHRRPRPTSQRRPKNHSRWQSLPPTATLSVLITFQRDNPSEQIQSPPALFCACMMTPVAHIPNAPTSPPREALSSRTSPRTYTSTISPEKTQEARTECIRFRSACRPHQCWSHHT